jgi:hypothetical protein
MSFENRSHPVYLAISESRRRVALEKFEIVRRDRQRDRVAGRDSSAGRSYQTVAAGLLGSQSGFQAVSVEIVDAGALEFARAGTGLQMQISGSLGGVG